MDFIEDFFQVFLLVLIIMLCKFINIINDFNKSYVSSYEVFLRRIKKISPYQDFNIFISGCFAGMYNYN